MSLMEHIRHRLTWNVNPSTTQMRHVSQMTVAMTLKCHEAEMTVTLTPELCVNGAYA